MFLRRSPLAIALTAMMVAVPAMAQQPARRSEPRGFDFSPDGVWRRQARRVRDARAAAFQRGDMEALNAPLRAGLALMAAPGTPQRSTMAVSGVLYAPVFLVSFKNTAAAGLASAAQYDAALFGTTPPLGRPFTVRTFYEQLSNTLLSVRGQVFGWIPLDSNDTWYEGNCNGLCGGGTAGGHIPQLMRETVQRADGTVDFGLFDNDGPDGLPNTLDDDGRVDLMVLIQPEVGAECQLAVPNAAANIWSHRFSYSGWTGVTITTTDVSNRAGGGFISVDDYIIQPGVGGSTGCDLNAIMPPGTIAHEMGHGLGLPDLYDTNPSDGDDSEGIGEWGLMSSGNYARPLSPAHMEGWSRLQLGWVTVRDLTVAGTYTLGAYTVADTIFRVMPTAANPRNEYFLIENRQAQDGDTALIGKNKGPGLLVYHVDGQQIQAGSFSNTVNSGNIHGLWILQADGVNALRSSTQGISNRGDAGDPYPGSAGRTAIGYSTNPDLRLNVSGAFPGFSIDSIRQLVPGGAMSLRLQFGALTLIRASDSTAEFRFRGASINVVRDLFAAGDTGTVDLDSLQISGDGRTQFRFVSWSDGLPRTHLVTLSPAGGSLIATLARRFRASYTPVGGGTISASGGVTSGSFVNDGDTIVLTPQSLPGTTFLGWAGDTVTTNNTLILRMNRPWTVLGNFQAQLAVSDSALRPSVMGAPYADTLRMSGGAGVYAFSRVSGVLPPGLILSNLGVISGTPTNDSTYAFTVRAASAGQQLDLPLTMTVTAPTVAAAAVMNQLLLGGSALSAEERAYMDLAGNSNGQYDIGDVTAWLDRNPGLLNPTLMRQLLTAGARP